MPYDLVIRGGDVVDGSGLARFRADVGVTDGRIARIGRIREKGRDEVDAEGHVVTPGFVDGHTHMDAQLFWDPLGTSSCWHGVTTVIMGNCGFSLAPASADQRPLVVRNLERAEDIPAEAMAAGIEWSWSDFASYLDTVDALPKGINYAAQVGHSALRTFVMGERAFEQAASADDLAAMERELRSALSAGALGFTTSRSANHETSDNRFVASRLATWEEVVALVHTIADAGAGVFELAQEPANAAADKAVRDEWRGRLRALAVSSGVPVSFGVLAGAGTGWREQLDNVDAINAEGGNAFVQAHSRAFATVLSFATRLPFDRLPEWAEVRSLPLDAQAKALRDPETRRRLVDAASAASYGRAIGAELRPPDYDLMRVLLDPVGPNPTVAQVAAQRGVHPVEAIIDLSLEADLHRFFVQQLSQAPEDAILAILRHPRSIVTFSDSGAHVAQIMDSSIQTHLLAYWVRKKQALTLEDAVRNISFAPARAWGFHDRGLVREGMVADLNVLDPDTVAPRLPEVAFDLPTGARRLRQGADGFRATVVSGQVVLRDGEHTGALPGKLLRGALAG